MPAGSMGADEIPADATTDDTATPLPSVFLSYARADDEAFVALLHAELVGSGCTAWWDRVAMPSRALTFLQEIRDAIDAHDRLLLVVGSAALRSDYVTAEWRYA